jgi:hypothetical protein
MRALIAALGIVLALAGCGSSDSPRGTAPTTLAAAAETPIAISAQQQAYLDAIERIDPYYAYKPDRALSRARGICNYGAQADISTAQLIKYTRHMLSGTEPKTGRDVALSEGQAKKVIKLARKHICEQ